MHICSLLLTSHACYVLLWPLVFHQHLSEPAYLQALMSLSDVCMSILSDMCVASLDHREQEHQAAAAPPGSTDSFSSAAEGDRSRSQSPQKRSQSPQKAVSQIDSPVSFASSEQPNAESFSNLKQTSSSDSPSGGTKSAQAAGDMGSRKGNAVLQQALGVSKPGVGSAASQELEASSGVDESGAPEEADSASRSAMPSQLDSGTVVPSPSSATEPNVAPPLSGACFAFAYVLYCQQRL